METKHTSGPWEATFQDADGMKNARCEIEAGNACLARVYLPFPFDTNYDERDANARLIAAAPELLESLVDLMFRHVPFSDKSPDALKARAAIAKATGKEQS